MEGMVTDLQLAREKQQNFDEWKQNKNKQLPIDLSVTVLTTGMYQSGVAAVGCSVGVTMLSMFQPGRFYLCVGYWLSSSRDLKTTSMVEGMVTGLQPVRERHHNLRGCRIYLSVTMRSTVTGYVVFLATPSVLVLVYVYFQSLV